MKQLRHHLQEFYASLYILQNQLEIHQPYTTDIGTLHHYGEELDVALFLADFDSFINSQIHNLILSEMHLSTLCTTFSTTLRVSIGAMHASSPLTTFNSTTLS